MENVPRENIDRGMETGHKESHQAENEASLLEKPTAVKFNKGGLTEKQQQGHKRQMDGGLRAWLIVFSSFLCNGLIFGVINSYSLVYVELQRILEDRGVVGASKGAGEYCNGCELGMRKFNGGK